MASEALERPSASHPLRALTSYTSAQVAARHGRPCAPPIRLGPDRRVPTPRQRILAFLATTTEATPLAIRDGAGLSLPTWRVRELLRALAREGLIRHRGIRKPPGREDRHARFIGLYRLDRRPKGGGR